MLDRQYLIHGLDAMCRAHETDFFGDGHRGAAIVSACYLCRETEVEDGVAEIIAGMIDQHWTSTPLCAPFPDEESDPGLLPELFAAMKRHMPGLRMVGHNVIFPSLALRVFRELPETITPSRVAGLCRLVECFDKPDDITVEPEDHIPRLESTPEVADLILRELLACMHAFEGRGQGWSGHLLTYGRALLDLRELGYEDLVAAGEDGFRVYLKRIRTGPGERDRVFTEHAESPLRPLVRAYWERRSQSSPALGHVFKYPYGFYGMLARATDTELKQRCVDEAFRIF
jgi:hypothetical protein